MGSAGRNRAYCWFGCTLFVAGTGAACSLLNDTGDLMTGKPPPGADGGEAGASSLGVGDASNGQASDAAIGDARGAEDAAPSNGEVVLSNDSFESGSTCSPWKSSGGVTAVPIAPGHTGSRACRVCTGSGSDPKFSIEVTGADAGTYQLAVWLRQSAGSSGRAEAQVGTDDDATHAVYDETDAQIGPQWSLAQVSVQTRFDHNVVSMAVYLEAQPGECVDVDDARLTWLPDKP